MSVTVTFQGPDWNQKRNPNANFREAGPSIVVTGFDLDFDVLTVYPPNEAPDVNLTLARKAEYMNEDGKECGEIGWVIQPDAELLEYMPELAAFVGQRYGRVIVWPTDDPNFTCGNSAPDESLYPFTGGMP